MKKIYILALTFFALFCGQVGYGQGFNSENYNDLLKAFGLPNFEDIKGDSAMYIQLDEVVVSSEPKPVPIDWDYSDNTTDYNNYDPFDQADTSNVSDPNAPCPTPTCPPGHSAVGCDCVVNTWYLDFDGDGYHSTTYDAAISPGSKWSLSTKGEDCDDTRSQYTTVCCTKVCESGYKLNEDTCECKLLLPCFGSPTSTSTASPNSPVVDEISNILNELGIGGDTNMAVIKLASGDLDDISKYMESLEILSKGVAVGSVFISIENFRNEPTTENLLQVLFDTSLAAVAFLPAAIAPWAPFVSFAGSFANASGATSYVLNHLANLIDRSVDCNVGLGLRNIFKP